MGLFLLTPLLVSSLFVKCRVPTISIITLLRSLADPGGAFDIPVEKCPPDRGSSGRVTGSPASSISSSPVSSYSVSQDSLRSSSYSSTSNGSLSRHNSDEPEFLSSPPPTAPREIFSSSISLYRNQDSLSGERFLSNNVMQSASALELLTTLFPHQGAGLLPYAKSITISTPGQGSKATEAVLVELPGKPKTLYVDGKSVENAELRDSIVALLDLADEHLQCSTLVIALSRSLPNLGELLHLFMYVGGTVVTKHPLQVNPAFVLVGFEI